MTTGELIALITIAVGMLTLMTALVKAIYKVAHIVDSLDTLTKAVSKLTDRVDTMDGRIYDSAIRGTQKR